MLRVALQSSLKNHKRKRREERRASRDAANSDSDEADVDPRLLAAGSKKDKRNLPLAGQTLDVERMQRMLEFKRKQRRNYGMIPFAIAFFFSTVLVVLFHAEVGRAFSVEKALVDVFVDPENVGVVTDYTPIAFSSIGSHEDTFEWMENTLLPMVLVQTSYLGTDLEASEWGYTMQFNRIIGAVRVMIEDTAAESCALSDYDDFYGSCYPDDGTVTSMYATDFESGDEAGSNTGPTSGSGTGPASGSGTGPPRRLRGSSAPYKYLYTTRGNKQEGEDPKLMVFDEGVHQRRRLDDPLPPGGPPSASGSAAGSASGSAAGSVASAASAGSASGSAGGWSAGSASGGETSAPDDGPPVPADDDGSGGDAAGNSASAGETNSQAAPEAESLVVAGECTLGGYLGSAWDATVGSAFKAAVADVVGSTPDDVTVTSLDGSALARRRLERRRHLLVDTVAVGFEVAVADSAAADAAEDELLLLQSDSTMQSSFVAAMVADGATAAESISVVSVVVVEAATGDDDATTTEDDGLIDECVDLDVSGDTPADFFAEILDGSEKSYSQLTSRKCAGWLSKATQSLEVEFAIYNGELSVLGVVTLTVTFERGGGVETTYSISSVRANPYDDSDAIIYDIFFIIGFAILLAKLIYDVIRAARHMRLHKWLTDFWNIIDVLVVVLSIVVMLHWSAIVEDSTDIDLSEYEFAEEGNIDFSNHESIVALSELITELVTMSNDNWQLRFESMILVLLVAFRMFKYFRFQPRLALLTDTLRVALHDLAHFFILLILVVFAFVVSGHVLFGSQLEAFSTLFKSTLTCLNMLLGEFDWDSMANINELGAVIYFWSFQTIVFLILFNMLLAIIMDAYAEVKELLGTTEGIGSDLAMLAEEIKTKVVSMSGCRKTKGLAKDKYLTVVEGTHRLLKELKTGKLKNMEKVTTEQLADAMGVDKKQAVRLMRRNSLHHAVDLVKSDSDSSDSDDDVDSKDVLRAVKLLSKRLDRVSDIVEKIAGPDVVAGVLPADRRVTGMFGAANVATMGTSPKVKGAFQKKGKANSVVPVASATLEGADSDDEEGEFVGEFQLGAGSAAAPAPASVTEPSITAPPHST